MRSIDSELETYDVQFRQSEAFGPNAFALPDGTIVFTDDWAELLEQEQRLLEAILLHEIAHVNHSMQMVAESIVATIAISYFVGDVSGAVEAFMGVGTSVMQNDSHRLMNEADNYAIEQLREMRGPQDFADAMKRSLNLFLQAPSVIVV